MPRTLLQVKTYLKSTDLGIAGLFDEFFYFLSTLGISSLFNALTPNSTKRQSTIDFSAVLLIYMMRIVSGLPFFWHIGPVLLRSQPLMRLVGFNGRQTREGTCQRGVKKKVHEENGNKLIVFDEDHYAIFDVYEVFILCNGNVAKPRGIIETIIKEALLPFLCPLMGNSMG